MQVDAERLRGLSEELAVRMDALEREAHEEAGGPFNLQSPKQIQAILFDPDRLGLPVRTKTPTGQPSTADAVLQDLAREFALPRIILDHRALSKLRSTYAVALGESVNRTTGRVHTSYHQAVASTGRLSSSTPNLQNIPVRTAEGRRIRQAFVPPPGFRLLSADYSQIELRIMAHLSGDEGLLGAFAAGRDIHRATAAEVGGVEEGLVDGEMRRRAKAVNFGLIYGMSAFGLARQLGIERGEAQEHIERYFERLSGGSGLHGGDQGAGPRPGLCRDRVRAAPLPPRHQVAQRRPPAVRGAHRDQRPDAGHRRRRHQAGHGVPARVVGRSARTKCG